MRNLRIPQVFTLSHNFFKTLFFAASKTNKKALIPLGIRAFPNFAFSSCGAYGNRTCRL